MSFYYIVAGFALGTLTSVVLFMKYVGRKIDQVYYINYELYEYFGLNKKVEEDAERERNKDRNTKGNRRSPDIP